MGDLLREEVFEGAQPRTCMVDVSQDLPTVWKRKEICTKICGMLHLNLYIPEGQCVADA